METYRLLNCVDPNQTTPSEAGSTLLVHALLVKILELLQYTMCKCNIDQKLIYIWQSVYTVTIITLKSLVTQAG